MLEPRVYTELRQDIINVLESKNFKSEKIKIIIKQMGIGKSYLQGNELPQLIRKNFPKLKFIIRVAPTLDTSNDDIFALKKIEDSVTYKFRDIEKHKGDMFQYLEDLADNETVYIFSITHCRFSNLFKYFLKYADRSVILIEEVHQYLAVGDAGSTPYGFGTGYRSGFDAKVAYRLRKWMKINGRILAFTATPTLHQQEYKDYIENPDGTNTNEKYSELFSKVNELADVKDIIANQSWVGITKPYQLIRDETQDSVRDSVGECIDSLIKRERQLEILQEKDSNITPKLVGMYKCGTGRGVWGCPIHAGRFGGNGKASAVEHSEGMVQIISNHLLARGYEEGDEMIATLQESGAGGNKIWNLRGEVVEKSLPFDEIKKRLLDPLNTLKHLIVVNKGQSGININNIGAIFIGTVRDAAWSREHIPNQTFGRGLRINTGVANLAQTEYWNNIANYLSRYPTDYGVDLDVMVETIKVANRLDIWYPKGLEKLIRDVRPTKVDVWTDAVESFRGNYCNSVEDGHEWLHQMTGVVKPQIVPFDLSIQVPCNGKMIDVKLNDKISEWRGDGTLDKFFNI
tara:strand:- start:57 stop:1772 length:1716 start_codon:yes stop_codon:yes gene_type:complete